MLTQNLYTNVYGSFICYIPKLETALMSSNRWMVKQMVAYPWNRILLSNKNDKLYMYSATWIALLGTNIEWKKPIPKGYKSPLIKHFWNVDILEMDCKLVVVTAGYID
jgi:hypothetical protein